ncbi:hypothetical protein [Psychrobacillus sp. FSL H8-0510]|uniref:hypothetical protein n=1 Tax=Psychrobacillus sp. FSL H8-0510 TaxID=2921394 RepID=UPI0030F6A8F3
MKPHLLHKGDMIKSRITSRLWIDEGEIFETLGITTSVYTDSQGVLFIDRNGGIRAFWSLSDYEVIHQIIDKENGDE